MRVMKVLIGLLLCALVAQGCGNNNAACNLDTNMGCTDNKVCEPVHGGQPACFAPVQLQGRVFDLGSSAAIQGARVVAIDANGAAASSVAETAADGTYSLRLPSERNADGSRVADTGYTLRADAANYQTYPGGVRPAIRVDTTMPAQGDAGVTVIQNATTDVGLLALPAGPRGSVSGSVQASVKSGVLVVGGGSTAISDKDGSFVLFNVTPGSVNVRGFAQNVQLDPATVTVTDGMRTENVVLSESQSPLGTVSGSLQLVNAGGVSATSVVLAVRETYNAVLDRGEVPRGLRLTGISGAFSFQGVPQGDYVVLAAFDNDGAVRDPDTSISGTDLVYVTVPAGGQAVQLPSSFKVTGALATISPGRDAPEGISTATPTFHWGDDSSEDGYDIEVYDAFGNIVWSNPDLPSHTGGSDVSVMYGGSPLTPGMYYQFRVTSWRSRGGTTHVPISRTEELRGVFFPNAQ